MHQDTGGVQGSLVVVSNCVHLHGEMKRHISTDHGAAREKVQRAEKQGAYIGIVRDGRSIE